MNRKAALVVSILIALAALGNGQPFPSRSYVYDMVFVDDVNNYYKYYWTVDEPNNILRSAVVCNSRSGNIVEWCGVGWSATTVMIGSDAVIGSLNGTAPAIFDFLLGSDQPPSTSTCPGGICMDSRPGMAAGCVDSLTSKSAFQDGRYLVLEFDRPLQSSDPCDEDVNLANQDQTVIWAMGYGMGNGIMQHTRRDRSFSFNWLPPVATTGSVTTAPFTTDDTMVTGTTTGNEETTGTSSDAPTDSGTTGKESDSESSSTGMKSWVIALIAVGAVLCLATIIGLSVVVAKLRKMKKSETVDMEVKKETRGFS